MINPSFGLIAWTLGVGLGLVLLGFAIRALRRVGQDHPAPTDDATLAALQMRMEMLESQLPAIETGLEHLKMRTEHAERLADRPDGSGARTS